MKNWKNITKTLTKVLTCLILAAGFLNAQGSANQVLTLQVMELNKIDFISGSPSLIVSNERTKRILFWISNGGCKKITVAAVGSMSNSLRIVSEETSMPFGTISSEVLVSDSTTRDFIVGLGRSAGKCILQILPISEAQRETRHELNVMTFTITSG